MIRDGQDGPGPAVDAADRDLPGCTTCGSRRGAPCRTPSGRARSPRAAREREHAGRTAVVDATPESAGPCDSRLRMHVSLVNLTNMMSDRDDPDNIDGTATAGIPTVTQIRELRIAIMAEWRALPGGARTAWLEGKSLLNDCLAVFDASLSPTVKAEIRARIARAIHDRRPSRGAQ